MAVKNTAKVIIGGKIITLGGYESEEYFQKVASYINKKMDELSAMPGYSRQPMETKHTLISLNITDDYFKAKKQRKRRSMNRKPWNRRAFWRERIRNWKSRLMSC